MSAARLSGCSPIKWLWGAVVLSLVLQAAVIYIPFLQQAFSTVSLSFERLVALRGGGEFGAVAARIEQGGHSCQDDVTLPAADALKGTVC